MFLSLLLLFVIFKLFLTELCNEYWYRAQFELIFIMMTCWDWRKRN